MNNNIDVGDMNAQICRDNIKTTIDYYNREKKDDDGIILCLIDGDDINALSFALAEMDKVAELTKQLAESREEVKRLRQYEIENPYLQ